jgi:hypothetical protein
LAVALIYVGDSAFVRVRLMHAKPGNPFETVTALRILAIDEKGNKTEYSVDPVQSQQTAECVHALFPHNGDPPCWYLKRKFAQPIPMTIFPSVKNRIVTRASGRAAIIALFAVVSFQQVSTTNQPCGLEVTPD